MAVLLGVYGLLGGYLRDYAGDCKGNAAAAHSDAITDFCTSGSILPPLPPDGLWGWLGIAGVAISLVGLAAATLMMRTVVLPPGGVKPPPKL